MEIVVQNRRTIKDFRSDKSFVVISIKQQDEPPAVIQGALAVLNLTFDDIHTEDHPRSFTPDMAQQIVDFVMIWHQKCQMIVCQCEAGISRSAGLAAALSLFFNGTDMPFVNGKGADIGPNGHFFPNVLVKSLVLRALQKG